MPENLVVSILRACRDPLLVQLSMLPHGFHVAAIHAAFPSISAKRSLHLVPRLLGDSRVTVLLPSIASFTELQTLVLGFDRLDGATVHALGPVVGKLAAHSLRHLTLDFHSSISGGMRPPRPRDFDVRAHPCHKETGSRGAAALGKSFAHLICLHTLNVACNGIGAEGVRSLAPALANAATLQHLNLGQSELGSEGAIALAQHLAHLTALSHLNLEGNGIHANGVAALAPELALLTALQHLMMAGNDTNGEGASALGPHLAKLTLLVHLNLVDNGITAEGTAALAPHLACLTGLTGLHLSANQIAVSYTHLTLPTNREV